MPNKYIPEILYMIRDLTIKKKNPLGLSGEECSKWANGLEIPRGGRVIIYTSCMYQIMSYSHSLVEVLSKFFGDPTTSLPIKFAKAGFKIGFNPIKIISKIFKSKSYDEVLIKAVKILKKIGLEFGYLYEDEPYSGTLLYEYGFHEDFAEYANWVYRFFKEKGVEELIVFDPHTADLLENVYPKFVDGFDLEIKVFHQVVLDAIESGKLKIRGFNKDRLLTFHDPCHFSKYLGIIEEPRKILKSIGGIKLVEHVRSGVMSVCCGGPIESLYPKLSKLMAKDRVEELLETDAREIVVACPICYANFDRVQDLVEKEYVVSDIIEILYDALE